MRFLPNPLVCGARGVALFWCMLLVWLAWPLTAAAATPPEVELTPTAGLDYPLLGRVAPRPARDIAASPWSIGGETMDRDFTHYEAWRAYLGPLGAKAVRLQAGWAKCERQPGVYDWAWLDRVVDDARAQGVQPWLELSYGNPLYPRGGGIGLADGFPASPEALAAWDRWVTAIVRRYRDRVQEWEIWNEPDINKTGEAKVEAYLDLHVRTATILRAEQPRSRIYALGLAGQLSYAEKFLQGLVARGKTDLVDAVTIHGYPKNPDDIGPLLKLREAVARLGLRVEVRQGETGAPSRQQENFALSKQPWSENTQTKWDLRRLLAHRAADIPMNLFTISDMHYRNPDGTNLRMNYKGLLSTKEDQTIAHVKPVYAAAQAVFTLFDATVRRVPESGAAIVAAGKWAVTRYEQGAEKRPLVAFWRAEGPVGEENAAVPVELRVPGVRWREPVLVDLRTCRVHRVPVGAWREEAGGTVLAGLPAYDAPMLVAEAAAIPVRPVTAAATAAAAAVPGEADAANWPRFRGADGTGVSAAQGLPVQWGEPEVRWRTTLPGRGHASPVVWGGRVFVWSGDETSAERQLTAVEAATGKVSWTQRYAATPYTQNKDNHYGSATPAVDAQRVYATWTTPAATEVVALTHEGREVWRRQLGPFVARHGSGASPVLAGGKVWLGLDQEGPSSLVALEAATGEVRHRIERRTDKAAYGTPCLVRAPGRPEELIFAASGHGLTSIDPESGAVRWEVGGLFPARIVASPTVSEGLILCSCGEGGTGRRLVAVRLPAGGQPATLVYDLKKGVPNVPSPLAHEGRMYLLNDNGLLRCVRTATGEALWEEKLGEAFYASPVWAEGRLYLVSRKGVVHVVAAGERFARLGLNPLGEASSATPAIAGDRIYFRTLSQLIAIGRRP